MTPQIEPITGKERAWVQSQLDEARRFVEAFVPECAGLALSLEALDLAWAAWVSDEETDLERAEATVSAVGAAFGHFLAEGGLLNWVIATDERGSDLALHGLPGRGDVLIYPAQFVAQRWQRRDVRFLKRSFRQITQHVRALATPSAPNEPGPDNLRPFRS